MLKILNIFCLEVNINSIYIFISLFFFIVFEMLFWDVILFSGGVCFVLKDSSFSFRDWVCVCDLMKDICIWKWNNDRVWINRYEINNINM